MNFAFRLLTRDNDSIVSTSYSNVYFDAYMMIDQIEGPALRIPIPIVNCSDHQVEIQK
jgi:hypothetical protein